MARLLVSLHGMSSIGKIGLFDSGLGGLTVLRALNKMLPDAAKVYYGDTLHLPYGDKSDEAIVGYSMEIVQFLKDQGCGLIVIACNSASAAAGKALEERFPELTFVNVIDPVVDQLASLSPQKVGLLGTRATVRHKLLDVIGDLSLVGTKIKGKLIAIKPGHHVNTEFAKKISKHIKDSKRNKAPQIDWNSPPLMDVTQIMNMLPHRPPFLLIDRIYELTT